MIQYYTYYSFGGYKDMLVGGQDVAADQTFYMPLAEEGTTDGIAKITVFEGDAFRDYPSMLGQFMSTGGFSVFFSKSLYGHSVLVVRDILGVDKDDNGRAIPFVFAMLGDPSDAQTLAAAAAALVNNDGAPSRVIGPLLHYDPYKNGLCFENAQLNQWLDSVKGGGASINTLDHGSVSLMSVPALIIATVNGDEQLRSRLSLPAGTVICQAKWLLPQGNTALCTTRRQEWNEQLARIQSEKNAKITRYIAIGGGVVLILLLMIFLKNC